MAKIKSVIGRQVFDSRGNPTVEAEIFLDDDTSATAISPSGASTGAFEAHELRDKEQKAAIESLQYDFPLQTNSLLEIQNRNQQIQQEMNRYLDIFKRHDLTRLAAAKPGLIQPRINKGTKDVFDSIEEDSRNIDSLDDGLQLQSDTQ